MQLSLELEGLTLRLMAAHDSIQLAANNHPAPSQLRWTTDGAIHKAIHRASLNVESAVNELRRINAFVERLAMKEA